MSELNKNIQQKATELYQELKIERDELKLKLGLMKLELIEQWEISEAKFQSFQNKARIIESSVEKAGIDIGQGLGELGKEIKNAYAEIKKGIKASQMTK